MAILRIVYETVFDDLGRTATAYAIVAAAVLPLLVLPRIAAARAKSPYALSTPEMLVFCLMALALPELVRSFFVPVVEVKVVQIGLAQCTAMILWLGALLFWKRSTQQPLNRHFLLHDLRLGVISFLVLTPSVYLLFQIVSLLTIFFGGTPDEHPLAKTDLSSSINLIMLFASACIAAPVLEECVFRGLLLDWARHRSWRPWLIFVLALLLLLAAKGIEHFGSLAFSLDLLVLMAFAAFGREVWKKWPSRTASAIVATAALFGALHSAVWPSPIPLTVLGLGLGIMTIRAGSVRPAIVAHALFNLVAVLFVLRRNA